VPCSSAETHARDGRREFGSEDRGVAADELAISGTVAEDPAGRDVIGPAVSPGDNRQRRGLALFAVGNTNRGSEIVQPVPDLDDDQQPMLINAEQNVHRERRIGWPGWQFEVSAVAVPLRQSEHQLLDPQMAGVSWLDNP
jgi:hypothetical protein